MRLQNPSLPQTRPDSVHKSGYKFLDENFGMKSLREQRLKISTLWKISTTRLNCCLMK